MSPRRHLLRFTGVRLALALLPLCLTDARSGPVAFSAGNAPAIVFQPKTELQRRVAERLAAYLGQVLGKPAQFAAQVGAAAAGAPVFILSADGREPSSGISAPAASSEAFAVETRMADGRPEVIVVGATERGLKRGVQRLIVASEQRSPGLVIPDLKIAESPWIPQREWALAPWDPNYVRGVFYNPDADKRLNVYLYGDEQIANYVAMFDAFGFSGCQLLESCNGFHDHGSPEAFQSVLRKYARAAHRQGEDVTDWVWAAQFDGYGWVDPTVTYQAQKGLSAFASMRWPIEKVRDRLQLLVANGLVEKTADGAYQLVNWDEFRLP